MTRLQTYQSQGTERCTTVGSRVANGQVMESAAR